MTIPGLPDGVEVVGWRHPTASEWSVDGFSGEFTRIRQGGNLSPCLVVEPAKGYEFRYNVATDAFEAIPEIGPGPMSFNKAVEAARLGKMVARQVWDGVSLCIAREHAPFLSVRLQTGILERYDVWAGCNPQADFLSDDWMVVGDRV